MPKPKNKFDTFSIANVDKLLSEEINKKDFAYLFTINKKQLAELTQAGIFNNKTKYKLGETLQKLISHLLNSKEEGSEGSSIRRQKLEYETELLRLEVEEVKGGLLPAEEVDRVYTQQFINVNTALDNLPRSYAARLLPNDIAKQEVILKEAVLSVKKQIVERPVLNQPEKEKEESQDGDEQTEG